MMIFCEMSYWRQFSLMGYSLFDLRSSICENPLVGTPITQYCHTIFGSPKYFIVFKVLFYNFGISRNVNIFCHKSSSGSNALMVTWNSVIIKEICSKTKRKWFARFLTFKARFQLPGAWNIKQFLAMIPIRAKIIQSGY